MLNKMDIEVLKSLEGALRMPAMDFEGYPDLDSLQERGYVGNRQGYCWLTKEGQTALDNYRNSLQSERPTSVATFPTFRKPGRYEGEDLMNNSLRAGAYDSLKIKSVMGRDPHYKDIPNV